MTLCSLGGAFNDAELSWFITPDNFRRTDFTFIASAMNDLHSDVVNFCTAIYVDAGHDVADGENAVLSWVIKRCYLDPLHPFDGEDFNEINDSFISENVGYVFIFCVFWKIRSR